MQLWAIRNLPHREKVESEMRAVARNPTSRILVAEDRYAAIASVEDRWLRAYRIDYSIQKDAKPPAIWVHTIVSRKR
jgi:hypothetical protein